MIYRKWSLLTGPTTIIAGIIGTFVNSDLLFVENDDSSVAMMVELPDVGEWKKVLRRPLKFYGNMWESYDSADYCVCLRRESLSQILEIGKAIIQTRFDASGDQIRSHDRAKKRNKAELAAFERKKKGIGYGSVGMLSSLMVAALSGMKKTLSRYKKYLNGKQVPLEETKPEKEQPNETEVLKEEIEKLKLKQLRLLGKDLMGMGLPELHALERQLNEGLWCIKERKDYLFTILLVFTGKQSFNTVYAV
ncbi:hypothetical protein PHJA_000083200 [Phtheirospermum japonicum]|uniref:K-box domain-containing protein n=1 Tax=Phtheirospermum japonicum TaxID=374723 RepID=A0A830AY68_9LAMI|nr:hypothetical protein PHJA_000083200 [Phtheirospermum japonicum]